MAYNSSFTGAEIESRLLKVVTATGATTSAAGKTGLVPAPGAGTINKVLYGDMIWKNLYTEINGSILQVTSASSDDLSNIMGGVEGFNATYNDIKAGKIVVLNLRLGGDDDFMIQADRSMAMSDSTEGKTILFSVEWRRYGVNLSTNNIFSIQVKEDVPEVKTVDVAIFENETGTLSSLDYQTIVDAYNAKSTIAIYGDNYAPMVIGFDADNDQYSVVLTVMVYSSNSYRVVYLRADIKSDKTYTMSQSAFDFAPDHIKLLDFLGATATVSTLVNLPNKHNIIANVTAATNLSVVSGMMTGTELQVRVNNTTASDIVQTLPNTGNYQSMYGTSVTIPANSFIELNIWYIGGKYVIRVGENS